MYQKDRNLLDLYKFEVYKECFFFFTGIRNSASLTDNLWGMNLLILISSAEMSCSSWKWTWYIQVGLWHQSRCKHRPTVSCKRNLHDTVVTKSEMRLYAQSVYTCLHLTLLICLTYRTPLVEATTAIWSISLHINDRSKWKLSKNKSIKACWWNSI